jgi:sugar/nucleoside kinase (ribokinase family)
MTDHSTPRFLIAGKLTREFVVLSDGTVQVDVPGGNALYAAAGLAIWEPDPQPGVVARVGRDFPSEWLDKYKSYGLDLRGVHTLAEDVDVRSFIAFSDRTTRSNEEPVVHFSRLGLEFPRQLLGYRSSKDQLDSRTRLQPTSLRQGDIPVDFMDANAAHLCPLDYLTHSMLPAILRQRQFTTVTLDPSPGYMNPTFFEDIPALLTGLTAFLPSEEEARLLFQGHSSDLWEIMEALAAYGCEIIVIKRGESGQFLYDGASHTRWEIPSYPARLVNPIGAGDAFCGGFLAGYRRVYDPLQAALYGNISASLVVEGNNPAYALEALPGLAEARLDALKQSARKV